MSEKFLNEAGLERVNHNIDQKLSAYVPSERTINSKPLTSNVTLNASDVGAVTTSQMNTAIQTAIQNTWNAAY